MSDERDLVFRGYLAFLDPPKETAAPAMEQLAAAGVQLKVQRPLQNVDPSLCWWPCPTAVDTNAAGDRLQCLTRCACALPVDRNLPWAQLR